MAILISEVIKKNTSARVKRMDAGEEGAVERKRGHFIRIPDEFVTYDINNFVLPKHYEKEDIESVFIPHGLILDRVER